MALNWYIAPVCAVDPENGWHPGSTSGCPGTIPGIARIHAYDPDPDGEPPATPTTCLVGAIDPQTRDGWVGKTLAEAQAIYEAFYGVAPTAEEVY